MGMYIDDQTVSIIQGWFDQVYKAGYVYQRFAEIGFRKGGTTPASIATPSTTMTALTTTTQQIEPSYNQKLNMMISAHKNKEYLFTKSQIDFLEGKENLMHPSEDQQKVIDSIWSKFKRSITAL